MSSIALNLADPMRVKPMKKSLCYLPKGMKETVCSFKGIWGRAFSKAPRDKKKPFYLVLTRADLLGYFGANVQ